MKLTREELLRNLKNVQEKYKDKIYKTFELNIYAMVSDVIDYLESEHFESSECRVESSLTRSNPPLELENYLKRIQELELKEKQWIETEKDYRDELKELKSNPPLKFEELKEGMWVWDKHFNRFGEYLRIDKIEVDEFGQKLIIASCVHCEKFMTRSYLENRFYRIEVKDE